MRVSLPISTAGCAPLGSAERRTSTSPAANPSRMTNSGVIGDSPTLPRTPSVPKYFLAMESAFPVERREHGERVPRRGDVVDADDSSAALDREQSRGEAAREPVVGGPPRDRAERRLARPAGKHGQADLAEASEVAQQLEVVRDRLAESEAGVDDDALARDARPLGGGDALLEEGGDFGKHVAVARLLLHGARLALHVHEAYRRAGRGDGVERAGSGERGDVVDHRRSGPERR